MDHFTYFGFQKQKLIFQDTRGKAVKALSPFSNDPQKAVYESFIDYATGDIREGSHYFKPLSRTIMQYVEHLESKFDGEIEVLDRKYVHADSVIYIGKEANNIDEQELNVKQAQEFVNEKLVYEFILKLTPEKAREIGIKHRSALTYLKKKATDGELNFKGKNVRIARDAQYELSS